MNKQSVSDAPAPAPAQIDFEHAKRGVSPDPDADMAQAPVAGHYAQTIAATNLPGFSQASTAGPQFASLPLGGKTIPPLNPETTTGVFQTATTQTGAVPGITPGQTGVASVPSAPNNGQAAMLASRASQVAQARPPAGNARSVILFDRVSKIYPAQPAKPALNNISMSISSGEFVFLVGHSGSGKSTFIRLINHEFVVSSGRLIVAGEDLASIRRWRVPYLRRNIGCVFQDFKLLPNKTAFQNVAFALEVIGKSRHIVRTQVPEVLRLVGLEDKTDKYPDQLSGGEQQRVSIARAIVNRPPLLICDEPTGNLDPQTSLGIMRLLDRINRTGTTIVVATHDREMVDSMRKRVVALENGYLVRDEDKGVYGLDA
ncbi:MAG: cell division ATP-binding protein FtsE [Coriobacteriales bacterium]|nr:cell division ATP-binding protein FtsE [Coriobacteriales bacterium]